MNFIDSWLFKGEQSVCLIDRERSVSYPDIIEITASSESLFSKGQLCFFLFENTIEHVLTYIQILRSEAVPLILPPDISILALRNLINAFDPDWIVGIENTYESISPKNLASNFQVSCFGLGLQKLSVNDCDTHFPDDLAVVVPTSGSTGNTKMVRWSQNSITSVTNAICSYLSVSKSDISTTILPLSYSYGLSVLHNQLSSGGSIFVEPFNLMDKHYWSKLNETQITILPLVPWLCHVMLSGRRLKQFGGRLRAITVAGGPLSIKDTEKMLDYCDAQNIEFFSMYGATEACPRISFVPPKQARKKMGSVGIPISNGAFKLRYHPEFDVNELIYCGENVAMGYASSREDLAKGDEFLGELPTGDYGKIDKDGFAYVQGRIKRFGKVHGISVNLDHLATLLIDLSEHVICVALDDTILIVVADSADENKIKHCISEKTSVPLSGIKIVAKKEIPVTSNGKYDYQELRSWWESEYAQR